RQRVAPRVRRAGAHLHAAVRPDGRPARLARDGRARLVAATRSVRRLRGGHAVSESSRVLVAIRVKAPVERAFTAFTEQIGQWWQPSDLFPITPGRTGTMTFETGEHGRLLETYADGSEFMIGAVRLWEPPHRLVVGWRQATFPADQDTELHVSFTEVAAEPA